MNKNRISLIAAIIVFLTAFQFPLTVSACDFGEGGDRSDCNKSDWDAYNKTLTPGQPAAPAAGTPPAGTAATPAQADPGKSTLMGTGFKFNPNDIAPTTKKYESNTTTNVNTFLETVSKILLILVSTGAVLSIVIGGFYMATSGGDTEKANKGKIIITYNIIAICIAMFSYAIIQFVIWIV